MVLSESGHWWKVLFKEDDSASTEPKVYYE